jgi:hypothetical protein
MEDASKEVGGAPRRVKPQKQFGPFSSFSLMSSPDPGFSGFHCRRTNLDQKNKKSGDQIGDQVAGAESTTTTTTNAPAAKSICGRDVGAM